MRRIVAVTLTVCFIADTGLLARGPNSDRPQREPAGAIFRYEALALPRQIPSQRIHQLRQADALPVPSVYEPMKNAAIPATRLPPLLVRALRRLRTINSAKGHLGAHVWNDEFGRGNLARFDDHGVYVLFGAREIFFSWDHAENLELVGLDEETQTEGTPPQTPKPASAPLRQAYVLQVDSTRRIVVPSRPIYQHRIGDPLPALKMLTRIKLGTDELEALRRYQSTPPSKNPESELVASGLSRSSQNRIRAASTYLLSFIQEDWVDEPMLRGVGMDAPCAAAAEIVRQQKQRIDTLIAWGLAVRKAGYAYDRPSALAFWSPLIDRYRVGALTQNWVRTRHLKLPPIKREPPAPPSRRTAPAADPYEMMETALKKVRRLYHAPAPRLFVKEILPDLARFASEIVLPFEEAITSFLKGLALPKTGSFEKGMIVRFGQSLGIVQEIIPVTSANYRQVISVLFSQGPKSVVPESLRQLSMTRFRKEKSAA